MNDYEAGQVFKIVQDLWPSYGDKLTENLLDVLRKELAGYSARDILQAIHRHRRDDLDALRPNWKAIRQQIQKENRGERRDDLRTMLDNVKRANKRWGSLEWTDWQAWDHHVAMQTKPIEGEDPDERRTALAARWRKCEAAYWRGYCLEHELTVPEYLS